MDYWPKIKLAGAVMALILFVVFTLVVKDIQIVWWEGRILGLLAYILLFASITLGEWRTLSKGKKEFSWFAYHHLISLAAIAAVAAHFIASLADNYQWGKLLTLTQYLGLSFEDKWLTFLSLGVLSFYVMLLVGATSAVRLMRWAGLKRWKILHSISYLAFFMAYLHAVNLGTDIKTSVLAPLLHPLIVFTAIIMVGLATTRLVDGLLHPFADYQEVCLGALLSIILLLSTTLIAAEIAHKESQLALLENQLVLAGQSASAQEESVLAAYNQTWLLADMVREVNNGESS